MKPWDKYKTGSESQDVVRGSSEIPLSEEGRAQMSRVSKKLKGQIDKIYCSDLGRAIESLAIVNSTNPRARIKAVTAKLNPWRLGGHEGQPTEKVLDDMLDRIANRPDVPAPEGRGPLSTRDGESFNDFRQRALKCINHIVQKWTPNERILIITHYRDIRVVCAWLENGAPKDLSIDSSEMCKKGDSEPGDLFRLNPAKMAQGLSKAESADEPGVYLLRHGATEWNG